MSGFDLASSLPLDSIAKIFVIIFLIGFTVFSFLVIRQVQVMCSVVESSLSPLLKLISKLLFLSGVVGAILVLILILS